jgi:hypothetical protein
MLAPKDHNTDFLVWCDNAPSLSNGTYSDVIHNVVSHDIHGEYDTSTGIFTCTSPGYFACSWGLLSGSTSWANGEVFQSALSLNGATGTPYGYRWESSATFTGYAYSRGELIIRLNEDDTLRIKVYQNQGGSINLVAAGYYNFFSTKKVAPEC